MVSGPRLRNVYELAQTAAREHVDGAFVECGVWRGGCAALMAYAAGERSRRRIWLFDSFEGLPEPTEKDGDRAIVYASYRATGALRSIDLNTAAPEDALEAMARLGIDHSRVVIRKGWFQETVPAAAAEIGPIAVLRLDGDWYESTKVCLEHLYDLVVPGGFVILDDYDAWEGCRRATDEFLAARDTGASLRPIHGHGGALDGRYIRKPAASAMAG